jgi:hypothetical protein
MSGMGGWRVIFDGLLLVALAVQYFVNPMADLGVIANPRLSA